jgi:hypothetical protein
MLHLYSSEVKRSGVKRSGAPDAFLLNITDDTKR